MKYKLEWNYKTGKNEKIQFTSDWISTELAIQAGEELEKLGKASDIYFYDEIGTSWILKELKKLVTEIEDDPHEITVYFDGGFQKETNTAGLGVVIFLNKGKRNIELGRTKCSMNWKQIMKQNMLPFIMH